MRPLALVGLEYQPGYGPEDVPPIQRRVVRPPELELQVDFIDLVAKEILRYGEYVRNVDLAAFDGLGCTADKAQFVMGQLPWDDHDAPKLMRYLGIDPAIHVNIIEAVHEYGQNVSVKWEDGEMHPLGFQWAWSMVITEAILTRQYLTMEEETSALTLTTETTVSHHYLNLAREIGHPDVLEHRHPDVLEHMF